MRKKQSGQPKNSDPKIHHYWAWIYGTLLTAYTAFTLFHVFMIPHDTVKVDEAQAASIYRTDDLKKEQLTEQSTSDNTADTESDRSAEIKGYSNSNRNRSVKKNRSSRRNASSSTAGTQEKNSDPSGNSTSAAPQTEEQNYQDDYIAINITSSYVNNTMVYVADIQLKNLGLLKSGMANDSFGRNVTEPTSSIAERLDAILAVNGDFYGFRDTGYVIRNGILYRSTKKDDNARDLVLWSDGRMEVIREGDITAEELLEQGALQVYSFGPGLVENGEITVNASSEVGQAMISNPRTAVGMIEPMHYVMVVSDGRTAESEGLSLLQLAQIMQELGCTTAYNLDGGGSTTMYFNGEVINNPASGRNSSSERSVSDIVYIGY